MRLSTPCTTACPWSVASQTRTCCVRRRRPNHQEVCFQLATFALLPLHPRHSPFFTNVFPGGVPADNPLLRVVPRRRRNSIALGGSAKLAPSAAGARRVKAQAAATCGRAPSRSRTQVACCATIEREQGRLMSIQQTRLSEKNGRTRDRDPQEACKTNRNFLDQQGIPLLCFVPCPASPPFLVSIFPPHFIVSIPWHSCRIGLGRNAPPPPWLTMVLSTTTPY